MRQRTWIVVGAAALLAAALGLRGGPDRSSAGREAPEAEGPEAEAGGRIAGSITHVRDGDTIELGRVAVRIANLDCAERDTAEGQAASARMRELVAGQEVACELEGRRSYDREVGTCALASSGEDLGELLISEGTCERWRSNRS
jgi:endonuclease YncB( thermonuclease family)